MPCLFTSITPAWSNQNLHYLAEKISTPCVFAYVRAALPGPIHALPFYGEAYVGYIAHENISGVLKLTRLVRLFAKRFTVQERLGQQTADTLVKILKPHGDNKAALLRILRDLWSTTMIASPLKSLYEWGIDRGVDVPLPSKLKTIYGNLRFREPPDRPYMITNFVAILDGVVSLNVPEDKQLHSNDDASVYAGANSNLKKMIKDRAGDQGLIAEI